MSPAPKRYDRPTRPGAAGSAGRAQRSSRRAEPEPEPLIDPETGEEIVEEEPPKPAVPMITWISVGGGVLVAVLLSVYLFGQRKTHLEVENMELDGIQNIVVKINGQSYPLGSLRPKEVASEQVARIPGRDLVIEYDLPLRGHQKKSTVSPVDFGENTERVRFRLAAEGIKEIEHAAEFCHEPECFKQEGAK